MNDQLDALVVALKARDEFLEKHPELKELQHKIDAKLDSAGENLEKRLEIMAEMLRENLRTLNAYGGLLKELKMI